MALIAPNPGAPAQAPSLPHHNHTMGLTMTAKPAAEIFCGLSLCYGIRTGMGGPATRHAQRGHLSKGDTLLKTIITIIAILAYVGPAAAQEAEHGTEASAAIQITPTLSDKVLEASCKLTIEHAQIILSKRLAGASNFEMQTIANNEWNAKWGLLVREMVKTAIKAAPMPLPEDHGPIIEKHHQLWTDICADVLSGKAPLPTGPRPRF